MKKRLIVRGRREISTSTSVTLTRKCSSASTLNLPGRMYNCKTHHRKWTSFSSHNHSLSGNTLVLCKSEFHHNHLISHCLVFSLFLSLSTKITACHWKHLPFEPRGIRPDVEKAENKRKSCLCLKVTMIASSSYNYTSAILTNISYWWLNQS